MVKPKTDKSDEFVKEEIDLLDIFKRIGKGIISLLEWFWNLLVLILVFIIKKWYYWFIGVILGVIASFVLYSFVDKYYETDMVLRSNAVPTQEMISYINRIHDYTEDENYETLENILNLSSEETENLVDLEAFWMIDSNEDDIVDFVDYNSGFLADTNYVKLSSQFLVRALVKKPSGILSLSDGLLGYINGNPYFINRNIIRQRQIQALLDRADVEIDELDSLQKKQYFEVPDIMKLKEGQLLLMSEQETELFHEDIFKLIRQKHNYEQEVEIDKDIFTIIEDFSMPVKPKNSFKFYAIYLIPISSLLGLIFALILTFWKRMKEIYNATKI